ncbi:sulfate ABC transporter substrate-binding protein, partial [Bacillus sp. AFS075960]
MLHMSRRQFLKVTATSLAGSSLALMGFSPSEAFAEVRQYK